MPLNSEFVSDSTWLASHLSIRPKLRVGTSSLTRVGVWYPPRIEVHRQFLDVGRNIVAPRVSSECHLRHAENDRC